MQGLKLASFGAIVIFLASPPTFAADCRKAIDVVFEHEGGYQNSKNDAGNWSSGRIGKGELCGGTKFGIACGHNPGVDVKNLTLEEASRIYENKQCKEIRISELHGQGLPTLLLDLTINMGAEASIQLLKRTINLLNGPREQLDYDGGMTDEVVRWFNTYTGDKTQRALFYSVLTLSAVDRYVSIVESNKKQAVWLLGWIRRVVPNEIEEMRRDSNSPTAPFPAQQGVK